MANVTQRRAKPIQADEFAIAADIARCDPRLSVDQIAAIVEEHAASRRDAGIFYTPAYVVDYIVSSTLGPVLQGKTPREIRARNGKPALSVLDPACGCGAFLLGAYQYLLDWYRHRYCEQIGPRRNGRLERAPGGEWRLTLAESRRILSDHIFGVDIEARAVRLTRLALALRAVGFDETGSAGVTDGFSASRLPKLDRNIRRGNALIGLDFVEASADFPQPASRRPTVAAVHWRAEFRGVLEYGGFDVVIGNPPYRARLATAQRAYLAKKFRAGTTDTAALFMLQSHRLTIPGGVNSFIVPKAFTYASNWKRAQQELLPDIVELVDAGKVWPGVKLEQVIYRLQRAGNSPEYQTAVRAGKRFIPLGTLLKQDCDEFGFLLNGLSPAEITLAKKIRRRSVPLGELCRNTRGASLQQFVSQTPIGWRVIGGKQIQRYRLDGQKGFLHSDAGLPPNALVQPGSILVQNIVAHVTRPVDHIKITATLVDEGESGGLVILDTVNQLTNHSEFSSEFLLALLHSRVVNWFVYRFIYAKAVRTMHFDGPVTSRNPMPNISLCRPALKSLHDRLTNLVRDRRQQSQSHGTRPTSATAESKRIGKELDAIVNEVFGLTRQDAAIIDSSVP